MKIKFLFLLIIISCNFFGQTFDNVLDDLVYKKQDSLIKISNLKSILIKNYTLINNVNRWQLKRYNEDGLMESQLKQFSSSSYYSTFLYDENGNVILMRRKKRKGDKRLIIDKGFMYFFFKHSYEIGGVHTDSCFIDYNSENKEKRIKEYSKNGLEIKEMVYAKDTIKVYVSNGLDPREKVKEIIIKDNSEIFCHYKLGVLNKCNRRENQYNSKGLLSRIKYSFGGKKTSQTKIFYDSKRRMSKKIILNPIVNINDKVVLKKIVYLYEYDDNNRLIKFEEVKENEGWVIKLSYNKNDLLKEILSGPNHNLFEREVFTYEFHKN